MLVKVRGYSCGLILLDNVTIFGLQVVPKDSSELCPAAELQRASPASSIYWSRRVVLILFDWWAGWTILVPSVSQIQSHRAERGDSPAQPRSSCMMKGGSSWPHWGREWGRHVTQHLWREGGMAWTHRLGVERECDPTWNQPHGGRGIAQPCGRKGACLRPSLAGQREGGLAWPPEGERGSLCLQLGHGGGRLWPSSDLPHGSVEK